MAIGVGSSSSFDDRRPETKVVYLKCPDPNDYDIMSYRHIGKYLIIQIRYPECENYEGIKILVFENINIDELKKQKSIDPHFSENKKFYSPIARFEPTEKGWAMAVRFCNS